MQLLQIFVAFVIFGYSSSVFLTKYTDCGGHGHIHSIALEPCPAEPCVIRIGQTYTTHINFTAQEHSTTLENICHGIIHGKELPFKVTPKNACGHGVTCPLMPGDARIYTASVTCPLEAPTARVAAKWEVKDQNGRDLICIVFGLIINQ